MIFKFLQIHFPNHKLNIQSKPPTRTKTTVTIGKQLESYLITKILCINLFIIVVCKSVRIGVVAREISLTGTEFRTREGFFKNKHNLLNTKFSPYKYIVNPVRNLMTFVHQNKQAQVHFYLPNQIATVT